MISSHPDNDDMRHFRFARTSGLPVDYFGRKPRITKDGAVFVCIALALIVAIII